MFMDFPVSGLHRLLHGSPSLLSSQLSKNPSLESVTEDLHTYTLLYPGPETLNQTQHHPSPLRGCNPLFAAQTATSHDDRGGLDIYSPLDVRIIIAQDGNTLAQQPRVLYDSQPSPRLPMARPHLLRASLENNETSTDSPVTSTKRRNSYVQEPQGPQKARHERSSSFAQDQRSQAMSPRSPCSPEARLGAFSNPQLRRARPSSSGGESTQTRVEREKREEIEALLGCMFGSTGLPTVSSTKVHIKATSGTTSPVLIETGTSHGLPRKPTPLIRSMTMEEFGNIPLSENAGGPNKSSLLLTRIFTVDPSAKVPFSDRTSEQNNPDSLPTASGENNHQPKLSVITNETEKPKQVKTSTYAIAIVLHLPSDQHPSLAQSSQEIQSMLGHGPHLFSQSPRRVESWPLEETSHVNELLNDMDRSIENVMAHWGVLNRVASSLETVAKGKIGDLLGRCEVNPAKLPAMPVKVINTNLYPKKKRLTQPTQREIQLPASALQQCDSVKKEVNMAGNRIALALKIPRAIVGQQRWAVWKDEARWVDQRAGGKEHNFFFFNLLTAFLGTHTDWLVPILGPRRRTKQAYQTRKDVSIIQNRTVIVSTDKMAARRLIFLLSMFFPNTQISHIPEEALRPPSICSPLGRSQSPPFAISNFREERLRRTLNRRPRGNRAAFHVKNHAHTRGVSFSDQDFTQSHSGNGKIAQQHGRRASDATSIRSLPVPISSCGSSRKSSYATTGTTHNDSPVTVAHFASMSPESLLGTSAEARPGSSGSLASLSLKNTLQRSESAECSNASTESGRWSIFSVFWGSHRESSTDGSDALSSQDGLGISGAARERRPSRPIGKLAQMVEEADKRGVSETRLFLQGNAKTQKVLRPTSVPAIQDSSAMTPERSTPAKNIPERPRIESPLKLSVNEKFGVVDVDLGMSNSFSSLGSSFSSPRASHTGASSFNESSIHARYPRHESLPLAPDSVNDAAGWLKKFHPDFAVQAVKPYKELKEDIERSMRSEPIQTPRPFVAEQSPPWTEVCSTLIADVQSFSITRLVLRRRAASTNTSQNPITPSEIEEEMVSERIMDLDPTLTDAVERILGQSAHSSRIQSRTASPSRHSDGPLPGIPGRECGKFLNAALKQIAKSVAAEEVGQGPGPEGARAVELDSTLREGVRKWLNG